MQIYAEYAFIENFCMDFTLLYAAKAAVKNPCRTRRILLPAALGAAFAVVYPLFRIEGLKSPWSQICGVALKLITGGLMCATAGKFSRFTGYIKFTAAFTALSCLLGGALFALFSVAKIDYESGGGYILSSVPVGLPLFFALLMLLAVKKIARKIRSKNACGECVCTIYLGGNSASLAAFYDSGNKVYYGGAPVNIIPEKSARKLLDTQGIKTYTDIHTVSGKGKVAVFKADKVEMDDGKSVVVKSDVFFGISPNRINRIIMHPDMAEVN